MALVPSRRSRVSFLYIFIIPFIANLAELRLLAYRTKASCLFYNRFMGHSRHSIESYLATARGSRLIVCGPNGGLCLSRNEICFAIFTNCKMT